LGELGVKLHGLATWWDVLDAARETGRLDAGSQAKVRAFLEDPEGWSTAHGGKTA
jgi:orotate phosphoribosyltransferase